MTIDALRTKADTIRAQAAAEKGAFDRSRKAVLADTNLTDAGKRSQISELQSQTNAKLAQFQSAELTAIEDTATALRRKIAGGFTKESDVIAFRDAQDRADALNEPHEALRIMDRALLTGDSSLASAIMRRAVGAGWNEVAERYSKDNPTAASNFDDLHAVEAFRDSLQQGFNRGAIYSPV